MACKLKIFFMMWLDMDSKLFCSINSLYNYIFRNFWTGNSIVGPDPGLYFQARFFRFLKSYLPSLTWSDCYYFLQAQGYWIRVNWDLFDEVINNQRSDGSWEYPLKEWKKYVSTVEGTWASLGLLETFKHTQEQLYLDHALKWHNFLVNKTGFQSYKDSLVINYFDIPKHQVPNNTTLALWFFTELYGLTEDQKFLEFNDKMIRFLQLCQNEEGEIRYSVKNEHYLCYHYNAFEFLDLYNYYRLISDERIRAILEKLAKFIAKGVTETGSIKYDCFQTFPEITFYSAVVGAALTRASLLSFKGYEKYAERAYNFVFKNQMPDGSFIHSRYSMPYVRKPNPYGFLTDKTRYPRPLLYSLQHLLIKANVV